MVYRCREAMERSTERAGGCDPGIERKHQRLDNITLSATTLLANLNNPAGWEPVALFSWPKLSER